VRLLQSLRLVHQLHFATRGIGSVFSTLGIIPSEFWYIWLTLAHFTFGKPVGTLRVLIVVLLVHQAAFWYTRIILGHFSTIGTVITFGKPVTFWYTEDIDQCLVQGIIPSEFWYIWCTLAHFTFDTSVDTPSRFLAHWDHSSSFSARLVYQLRFALHTEYRISVYYTRHHS